MTYDMLLLVALLGVGHVLAQTPTLSLVVVDLRTQITSTPRADVLGSIVGVNSGRTTVEVGCASSVPFRSCLVDRMNVTQGPSWWGYEATGRPGEELFSEGVTIKQACQLSTPAGQEICTWVGPKGYGKEQPIPGVSTPTTTNIYTTSMLSAYIRNVTITAGAEKLAGSTAAAATSTRATGEQTGAAPSNESDDNGTASLATRSNFLIVALAIIPIINVL
ncbi:unnamed protein product [Clonostachys rosea]|uniref:Ig-like domain-containing protein n=1 Tax=Bionectria ochroleuca TaxID=29856 RepID=A0ABY6V107_BIOOC|nr:unnamed protein product [Clonostachys rosea]